MEGQDFKQFLDGVERLVKQTSKPTVFDHPGDPRKVLMFNHATGDVQEMLKEPAEVSLGIYTPQDLQEVITAAVGRLQRTESAAVEINVEAGLLSYFPDHDDTRRKVGCTLTPTPQHEWFNDHAGSTIDQVTLCRDLRITLAGCVPPNLLAGIKQVRWQNTADTNVSNNSLGKSVINELVPTVGANGVPEEITVQLPLYAEWRVPYRFDCFIEIDVIKRCFMLTPYPMALETIREQAAREIGEKFKDLDDLRVIYT